MREIQPCAFNVFRGFWRCCLFLCFIAVLSHSNCAASDSDDEQYVLGLRKEINWYNEAPDFENTKFTGLDLARVVKIAKSGTKRARYVAIRVLTAVKDPPQIDTLVALLKDSDVSYWGSGLEKSFAAQIRTEADEKKAAALLVGERIPFIAWVFRNTKQQEYLDKIIDPKFGSSAYTSPYVLVFIRYRLKHSLPMDVARVEAFLKNACLRQVYDSAGVECARTAAGLKYKWVVSWLVDYAADVRQDSKEYRTDPYDHWNNDILIEFERATGEKIGALPPHYSAFDDASKKKVDSAIAKLEAWWEKNKTNPAYHLKP